MSKEIISIQQLIILQTKTIKDALLVIDKNAQGIAFVVDEAKKMVGVVTDGDIRRALLNDKGLSTPILQILQENFTSLPYTASIESIQQKLTSKIKIIPLLNEEGIPVDFANLSRFKRIPVLEPFLNGNELKYVTQCIKTNWISSQGKFVRQFEDQFTEYTGAAKSLAVSNGTVALHLALEALKIGKGDEVIVPNLTFAASANAVIHANATPVFADVNPADWTISIDSIKSLIGPKTKAIMPVHLYGHPCDMDPILEIAKQHGLYVIEDAAEAIGTLYKGKPVGCIGDVGTFSFFGNKTITTGEGGMVVFKDEKHAERGAILRDHGMSKSKRYWHNEVGYNYRLTNLQAAVGVAQMEQLEKFVAQKREIARTYNKILGSIDGVTIPPEAAWAKSSYWIYCVLLDQDKIKVEDLSKKLLANGIESRPFFYPMTEMPPYINFKKDPLMEHSLLLSRRGISLPTSVYLTSENVKEIGKKIKNIIQTRGITKAYLSQI